MLYARDNPAECGLKVNGMNMRDMGRYMQRTRRLLGKPGSPNVTDNFRVIESAQEITYRPAVSNVESDGERVLTCARTHCGSSVSAATPGTRCASARSFDNLPAPRPP